MNDALRTARPWFKFGGFVLVVAVLYWAQVVLVPVALAILFTFVLTPVVAPLQRRIGRVAAVLIVAAVTFAALGVAGWAIATQLKSLALELPTYQQNVRQKVRDIRWLGKGGSVAMLQDTVQEIESEISPPSGTTAKPLVVASAPVASLWGLQTTMAVWMEPLANVALVMTLVIFMLIERQDLRDRLISLLGQKHLTVTTRAFDEAGHRVSRYLVAQSLINAFYGISVGIGLYLIGVPYPILWGALATALRFVPYVGPLIAAVAPILVSLAAFDGWTRPFVVLALYGGLELFTNFVVESLFFSAAAGVSQVGLLIAVAFWTWLWGPLGLLMATPLTVCLVVIGKYVPGFDFISTLLADSAVLESDVSFYQRLLAGDQLEAADLIEQHAKKEELATVFDTLFIPALTYAERDRIEGRLSVEEEEAIIEASRELVDEAAGDAHGTEERVAPSIPVLGWPAHGESDALALRMLGFLFKDTPFELELLTAPTTLANALHTIAERGCRVVCIADLPPSAPAKSRHLVKRLRAALPELTIVVGRWAPAELQDESNALLQEAGADHVGATLMETKEVVERLVVVADAEAVSGRAGVDQAVRRLGG